MKNKLLKKIVIISTVILMLISSPIIGYQLGFQNRAYAVETVENYASKLAPIVAYMGLQYKKVEQTVENLSNEIEKTKDRVVQAYYGISATSKVINSIVFNNMTVKEANNIYGTSFTENTLNEHGLAAIKLKMINGDALTAADFHILGINRLFAENVKVSYDMDAVNTVDILETLTYNDETINVVKTFGKKFYAKDFSEYKYLFDYFPVKVNANATFSHNASWRGMSLIRYMSNFIFENNSKMYKITINPYLISYRDAATGEIYDLPEDKPYQAPTDKSILGKGTAANFAYDTGLMILYRLDSSTWVRISDYEISKNTMKYSNLAFLNWINSKTGVDVTKSAVAGQTLENSIQISRTFDNVFIGENTENIVVGLPTADILNDIGADTNIDAEAIISNVANQGEDVNTMDVEVTAYTDTNGNTEIQVTTDAGTTDTSITETDYPDTTGDTNVNEDGTGSMNIPILGTILSWLKKILQMLKDIYDTILNHFMNPADTGTDTGTDWGNFKNFFDIFWIFYYLIIIAILILLKFFSVVMAMLTIPANTALFEEYPTMLSGLNYIKNIKVGGFNVTLQTLFEYMFTIFFFGFIVITLQKLYHSVTGIERQAVRENKDIKIDSNDINKHYTEYSSYNRDLYNKDIYGKGKDVDNIKLTGWGDEK